MAIQQVLQLRIAAFHFRQDALQCATREATLRCIDVVLLCHRKGRVAKQIFGHPDVTRDPPPR
jgi:hypothetical protein